MFIKPVTFTFATESLGELECLVLRRSDVAKVEEQLGKNIELSTPEDYVRTLVSLTCRRSCPITAPLLETSLADLSFSDVASLSDEELETFSEKYLKENPRLYKESSSKLEKRPEGEVIHIGVLGDVQYPRKNDETAAMYLYRLASIEKKEEMELLIKTTGPMEQFVKSIREMDALKTLLGPAEQFSKELRATSAASRFSQSMFSNISRVLAEQRLLNENLSLISKTCTSSPALLSTQPTVPECFSKEDDEKRQKEARELKTRLDLMIEAAKKANDLSNQINEIQKGIFQVLDRTGAEARNYSKTTVWLSSFVIFLTLVALISNTCTSISMTNSLERVSRTIEVTSHDHTQRELKASGDSDELIQQLIDQHKLALKELDDINRSLSSKGQAPGQSPKSTLSK